MNSSACFVVVSVCLSVEKKVSDRLHQNDEIKDDDFRRRIQD